MKEYWWTPQTEQKIYEWIETNDPTTWFEHIQPALKCFAGYLITKYCNDWYNYSATKEDMVATLVTDAAISLMARYDKSKGKPWNFIYSRMKTQIHSIYQRASMQRRDYKLKVSLESYLGENTEWPKELAAAQHFYDLYNDPEFIAFFIQWWKEHLYLLSRAEQRIVLTIIDILEHPDAHKALCNPTKIKLQPSYTIYLQRKFHVTRERIRQIFFEMRRHSKRILYEYENQDLIRKLIVLGK